MVEPTIRAPQHPGDIFESWTQAAGCQHRWLTCTMASARGIRLSPATAARIENPGGVRVKLIVKLTDSESVATAIWINLEQSCVLNFQKPLKILKCGALRIGQTHPNTQISEKRPAGPSSIWVWDERGGRAGIGYFFLGCSWIQVVVLDACVICFTCDMSVSCRKSGGRGGGPGPLWTCDVSETLGRVTCTSLDHNGAQIWMFRNGSPNISQF